jgi:uncharacterized membrane protein YdjX (TVP38/TMEM64 family)
MGPSQQKLSEKCRLAAGIALAMLYGDRLDVTALEAWVSGADMVGPLAFIVIYAIACHSARNSAA